MQECVHCHKDTAIANPSGFCDHVHYPEGCEICQKLLLAERAYRAGFETSGEGYNGEYWGPKAPENFEKEVAAYLDSLRSSI